ncbi:translation initiation factor IF-1 [Alphaproteobacteria bacterium endosymbiont of Tiliacea citrago]|uniref:translation initiation factor IF-1 n=1 Tax=Alphaproteobacteria bacterium endosymbiont of Tiliacea citrago TaxID=3077944 RepID=UPI00313EC0BB
MSKDEDKFEVKGTVLEVGRNGLCLVETDNGKKIQGIISGKIRTYKIKILKGDKVTVSMTKYDKEKGIITHREKVQKNYPYSQHPNK